MWELDYKESWAPKNWCFWIVVLEKTLESPPDCKIKPVHPKKKSVLNIHWKDWRWSSNNLAPWWKELIHYKSSWCWERLKAGEGDDRGRMIGWHHQFDRHEFEQALGVGDGQGSLACCSAWGHNSQTWLRGWTQHLYLSLRNTSHHLKVSELAKKPRGENEKQFSIQGHAIRALEVELSDSNDAERNSKSSLGRKS